MRFSRPSAGTILGGVALFVALGGTALAASATVVNIADPTTPANVAHVNSAGQLQTAGTATVNGYVGQTIPKSPFFSQSSLANGDGGVNTVITANEATAALTRLDITNNYGQTNGAPVEVSLYEQPGGGTACEGDVTAIGTYDVPAGQTFSDAMDSPIVLKPATSGGVWCLLASVLIEGNPTNFVPPALSFSGYVVSGTLPAGSVSTAGLIGARTRRVTR